MRYEPYPGILLDDLHGGAAEVRFPCLEVLYCRSGAVGSLAPGDFSVQSAECSEAIPPDSGEGIRLLLGQGALSGIGILSDTGIDLAALIERFSEGSVFTANERTERCFTALYDIPDTFADAYRRLRSAELILLICGLDPKAGTRTADAHSDQVEIIRRIHAQMVEHMERRFTIELLAIQYHMNPTTLKTVFKSVYGNSIAAHVRGHRMEKAASLLRDTDQSISEVARQIGYDSQSRFTSAFREYYGQLPKEFRKCTAACGCPACCRQERNEEGGHHE